jgi:hypothetical protein
MHSIHRLSVLLFAVVVVVCTSTSVAQSTIKERDHRGERDDPGRPSQNVPVHPSPDPTQPPPVAPRAETPSFWTTLPGILTGVAGIIGAIAALVVAFYRKGK